MAYDPAPPEVGGNREVEAAARRGWRNGQLTAGHLPYVHGLATEVSVDKLKGSNLDALSPNHENSLTGVSQDCGAQT